MFLVLIASNIYTEYDLSLIACPHHLLHQIYLPRTPSISTEAAAKDEAHTEKAQVSDGLFCSISSPLQTSCVFLVKLLIDLT